MVPSLIPPEINPPGVGQKNNKLQLQRAHFSGPLPPPSLLEQYEQCVPGAGERIIRLTEAQGDHRRLMEKTVVNRTFSEARFGQVCAVLVALAGIGAAAYVAVSGHEIAGSILGGSTMAMIVTAFL